MLGTLGLKHYFGFNIDLHCLYDCDNDCDNVAKLSPKLARFSNSNLDQFLKCQYHIHFKCRIRVNAIFV